MTGFLYCSPVVSLKYTGRGQRRDEGSPTSTERKRAEVRCQDNLQSSQRSTAEGEPQDSSPASGLNPGTPRARFTENKGKSAPKIASQLSPLVTVSTARYDLAIVPHDHSSALKGAFVRTGTTTNSTSQGARISSSMDCTRHGLGSNKQLLLLLLQEHEASAPPLRSSQPWLQGVLTAPIPGAGASAPRTHCYASKSLCRWNSDTITLEPAERGKSCFEESRGKRRETRRKERGLYTFSSD